MSVCFSCMWPPCISSRINAGATNVLSVLLWNIDGIIQNRIDSFSQLNVFLSKFHHHSNEYNHNYIVCILQISPIQNWMGPAFIMKSSDWYFHSSFVIKSTVALTRQTLFSPFIHLSEVFQYTFSIWTLHYITFAPIIIDCFCTPMHRLTLTCSTLQTFVSLANLSLKNTN